jgi:hypothetical protein
VALLKTALVAATPTSIVCLCPIDGKSALILAGCPIIDDFFTGNVRDVHYFSPLLDASVHCNEFSLSSIRDVDFALSS